MVDGVSPETVAVQIVNYRTRRYLERCVETVVSDLRSSSVRYEINLLDNASGEDLADVAASVTGARAFSSDVNLGFGGGHNLLARQTEAPYLVILNPDVEFVARGSIERLVRLVAGDDRVAAAGPKLIAPDGKAQPYDHGRLRGVRAAIALRGGHAYWRETEVRQEVAWVSGAAMVVEHAAFTGVDGFDERLFLYKEDEDLCLRLRDAGGGVIYEPAVRVLHHESVVADRHREMAGASRYYFEKHFRGRRSRRAFAVAHQILAYLRL